MYKYYPLFYSRDNRKKYLSLDCSIIRKGKKKSDIRLYDGDVVRNVPNIKIKSKY